MRPLNISGPCPETNPPVIWLGTHSAHCPHSVQKTNAQRSGAAAAATRRFAAWLDLAGATYR
jgi:hypothetical protein